MELYSAPKKNGICWKVDGTGNQLNKSFRMTIVTYFLS